MFAETVDLRTFSEVIFQMFAETVATVRQLTEFRKDAKSQQLTRFAETVATVWQLATFKKDAKSQQLAELQTVATFQKFAMQVSKNFHCAEMMHVLAVMFTTCMSFFSLMTSSTTCVVLQIHTGLICTMSCTVIP